MQHDPYKFDMPFRPNYEMRSLHGWGMGVLASLAVTQFSALPLTPFLVMGGISAGMGATRLPAALRVRRHHLNLLGTPLQFIDLKKFQKRVAKHPDEMWLGEGFTWENRHVQLCYELLNRNLERDLGKKYVRRQRELAGDPWIHGLEHVRKPEFIPLKNLEGHTLWVGTTGSGKTRGLDLVVSQDIVRSPTGCVFIIDPKGDKELKNNARRMCEAMGMPERFMSFHPAFPEDSIRINPLKNYTRVTELASRISGLLPSEDVFSDFSWNAINNILQGLYACNEQPTLKKVRHYIEGGIERLVIRVVEKYLGQHLGADKAQKLLDENKPEKNAHKAEVMARYRILLYRTLVHEAALPPNSDIEGVFTMFEHDRVHFSKMVASLLPTLNMLTSGEVGELLSPDSTNLNDQRVITDTRKLTEQGKVVYIGLDSLTDSKVASAIGSMLLADLCAVAGDRYNFEDLTKVDFVSLYVDEASECLNQQLLMLLNKARGSKFRLTLATQTIPDFIARLGNRDLAMQFLGNLNNTISLRIIDNDTQRYITESMKPTRIKSVSRSQGTSSGSSEPALHTGGPTERLETEEVSPVPQQLMGSLPNLEFFARISGGRIYKGKIPILKGAA